MEARAQKTDAPAPDEDRLTRISRVAAWVWNLTLPALFQAPVVTWREMWALLWLIGLSISARWPLRARRQNASPQG